MSPSGPASPPPAGVVLLSTAPSLEVAHLVARTLVEEQLAACVNVVPGVRSIYRWEGKVQDDAELLLVIKTTPAREQQAVARLRQVHPYTCPEAIALPIVGGNPAYLAWLQEVVP
jgi:periplasmic divalent cation tolerance protein